MQVGLLWLQVKSKQDRPSTDNVTLNYHNIMKDFNRDKHIRIIQELDYKEQHQNVAKASLKSDYIDANTINVDLDAPLYRIMRYDRLCDILRNNRLGMVHPQCWDDPYEVFLMRSYGLTSQGQNVGFEPVTQSLYGMCFTLKRECDGMWRSFTANSCAECSFCKWLSRHGKQPITVKVKTTGRKLMNAFYDINDPFHSLCYWIGKVDYLTSNEISQMISDGINLITDNTAVNLIRTLLVKRKPFVYEEEVRLLFNMSNDKPADQLDPPDLYYFQINPNVLFDEIEFSPWVSENDVNKLTKEISKHYSGKISRSSLYDEPGIHITV